MVGVMGKTGGGVGTNGYGVVGVSVEKKPAPTVPPARLGGLRDQAAALATTGQEVEAYQCDSCGSIFESPGEAVFECSRCSGTQVEENRCASCGLLMARLAESSCPDCESGDITPMTAWEQGGELYESEAAVEVRRAEAAANALTKEALQAESDLFAETERLGRVARNKALLPRAQALRARLDPASAPRLCRWLDQITEDLCRQEDGTPSTAPLEFNELALLTVPGCEDDLAFLDDYDQPYEDQAPIQAALKGRMRARIRHPGLLERTKGSMFSHGCALGVEAEDAVDAILDVLDWDGLN